MNWEKVCVCKICNKIYSNGIPEICEQCGTQISTINNFAKIILGTDTFMMPTENLKIMAGRKKWFKWELKEL